MACPSDKFENQVPYRAFKKMSVTPYNLFVRRFPEKDIPPSVCRKDHTKAQRTKANKTDGFQDRERPDSPDIHS